MPRRNSAQVLEHAPLVQALTQVRFAAVLDMPERIPNIQRELKALGFPRFEQGQVPQIVFLQPDGQQKKLQFAPQWLFLSADRTSGFVLTTEFITFITSAYTTFEEFLKPVRAAAEILARLGSVELMDRVGLRYIDLVRPAANESVSDYVTPQLLGIEESKLSKHGARRVNVATEIQFATRFGTLVFRLRQLPPGAWLPPDLDGNLLKGTVTMSPGDTAFALDCDHYRDSLSARFEPAFLEQLLWDLHSVASDAFKAAATPHALKVWGPEKEVAV